MHRVRYETANEPTLVIDTPFGQLCATYTGDPGYYEGIAVDLVQKDGVKRIAVVECSPHDAALPKDKQIYPTLFHTFAYNGQDEEPVRTDFDENGELALA